jgi:uncharacterized coiled-coil protein SlyX
MELTQELINLVTGVLISSIIAIIGAVFTWIRAAKMMPKEAKGMDLDNLGKEASVADQFNDIANKAAEQAVNLQTKLLRLENDYNMLKFAHDELNSKVVAQDLTIKEQAIVIDNNNIRLNEQEIKMCEQDEVINELKFDLGVAQQYNSELIVQMKNANLIPLEAPKRKYARRTTK